MVYTSSDILTAVKRNQTLATSAFRFQDSDLYAMVYDEIESLVVPMILRLHADRLLFSETIALVDNQSSYEIPYRAVGSQVRDLLLQDSATNPTWRKNLKYIEYTDAIQVTTTGEPYGFYFTSDSKINLVPNVGSASGQHLFISYPIKHSVLVDSATIGTISSVDYVGGTVTYTVSGSVPFSIGSYCDFIQSNARSKARILSFDKVVTNVAGLTLTFAPSDIPLGLIAGDRVALSNQTDVLLLPDECFKYLCKATEMKILVAQKDLDAIAVLKEDLEKCRRTMESILTPRIVGEPRVMVNRNGLLRSNRRTFRNSVSGE